MKMSHLFKKKLKVGGFFLWEVFSYYKLIGFYHGKCIKWLSINSCPLLILSETKPKTNEKQNSHQIAPGVFAISGLYNLFP